jgi:hypothetical protein
VSQNDHDAHELASGGFSVLHAMVGYGVFNVADQVYLLGGGVAAA